MNQKQCLAWQSTAERQKKSNKGDSQLSPGMLTSRSPIHSAIQPSNHPVAQSSSCLDILCLMAVPVDLLFVFSLFYFKLPNREKGSQIKGFPILLGQGVRG